MREPNINVINISMQLELKEAESYFERGIMSLHFRENI